MQLNSLLAKGLSYTLFCQAVIQFILIKLALGESQREDSLRVREHASNFHANDKLLVLPQPEADASLIDMLGKNNRQRRESLKFELSKLGPVSHFPLPPFLQPFAAQRVFFLWSTFALSQSIAWARLPSCNPIRKSHKLRYMAHINATEYRLGQKLKMPRRTPAPKPEMLSGSLSLALAIEFINPHRLHGYAC